MSRRLVPAEETLELGQQVALAQKDFRTINKRPCVDDVSGEEVEQLEELIIRSASLKSFLRALKEHVLVLRGKGRFTRPDARRTHRNMLHPGLVHRWRYRMNMHVDGLRRVGNLVGGELG